MSAAACDGCLLLDCDGVEEGADPAAEAKGTTAGQATAFSVCGIMIFFACVIFVAQLESI